MTVFLIHDAEKNQYQEVLQVTCVVSRVSSYLRHAYQYEKNLFANVQLPTLNIRDSYKLNSVEDIAAMEAVCKTELLSLLKEKRDKVVANHRAVLNNVVLRVNSVTVFDFHKAIEYKKAWDVTDEELEQIVQDIHFSPLENGTVYEDMLSEIVGCEFLI